MRLHYITNLDLKHIILLLHLCFVLRAAYFSNPRIDLESRCIDFNLKQSCCAVIAAGSVFDYHNRLLGGAGTSTTVGEVVLAVFASTAGATAARTAADFVIFFASIVIIHAARCR